MTGTVGQGTDNGVGEHGDSAFGEVKQQVKDPAQPKAVAVGE
ncbi:hypothetical protein OG562_02625 [Streptomyces sp. NBC_01275]|nr:hypothetical protein [Streptomyces sp. NBC_01275]MCX4759903.1 hypothetical protein [Streptomyces sp. NBC_01275]